jgi:phosphate/sulfate permease
MDFTPIVMWLGFILAAYAVVGNDVIQTNSRRPWWVLFIFAGSILVITLVYGWYTYHGDVSYERLSKYPLPQPMEWFYLFPPLVLLFITRVGLPVSTTFMVLTFFNPENLMSMLTKSVSGYIVAFVAAIALFIAISRVVEKQFIDNPITPKETQVWMFLQWCSTGFLWSQWLIQDFANIYAYLPRQLSLNSLLISIGILLVALGFIFYSRGGKIQKIVLRKTNTTDVRSATIIDATYALVLLFFKNLSNIPMSTTWVFIGLLAGREIALRWRLDMKLEKGELKDVLFDLGRVTLGLVVSIALVFFIKVFT